MTSLVECPAFLQAYTAIPNIELRITCIRTAYDSYDQLANTLKETVPKEAEKYSTMCEQISAYILTLQAASAAKALVVPLFQPSAGVIQLLGGGKETLKETPTPTAAAAAGETKTSMSIFDDILTRNPHQAKLRAMAADICSKCLSYGGPEYPTKVFAAVNNDNNDNNNDNNNTPLLRHWIQSMEAAQGPGTFFDDSESLQGLKGEAFFVQATLLHGAMAWKYTIDDSKMRQRFLSLLDEVCDPAKGPWDAVKNSVFLVACCVSSVKDSVIYTGVEQQNDPLFVAHNQQMTRYGEEIQNLQSAYEADVEAVTARVYDSDDEDIQATVAKNNQDLEQLTKTMTSTCAALQKAQSIYAEEFSTQMRARATSKVNFIQTQSIVEKHMNTICSKLLQIENDMKSSGELATLAALQMAATEESTTKSTVLRQDDKQYLGQHPNYIMLKELFELPPSHMPGCECITTDGTPNGVPLLRKSHLYLFGWNNVHNQFIQNVDKDIQGLLTFHLDNMNNACVNYDTVPHLAKDAVKLQFKQRLNMQPFILWLLHVSRRFAPHFHTQMRSILPAHTDYTASSTDTTTTQQDSNQNLDDLGDLDDEAVMIPSACCYHEASLKGLQRCLEKTNDDYHFLDGNEMPTGARLLDVVRGLVVSPSIQHLVDCYHRITQHFTVLRVKNGFTESNPKFHFRQILMNLEMPGKIGTLEEGCSMIVEVQLNLEKYVEVKHTIHRFYSVLRCTNEEELDGVVKKKTNAF